MSSAGVFRNQLASARAHSTASQNMAVAVRVGCYASLQNRVVQSPHGHAGSLLQFMCCCVTAQASVNSSGKYAFVEFRTPEMATAALDLNGQVGGCWVRRRRQGTSGDFGF